MRRGLPAASWPVYAAALSYVPAVMPYLYERLQQNPLNPKPVSVGRTLRFKSKALSSSDPEKPFSDGAIIRRPQKGGMKVGRIKDPLYRDSLGGPFELLLRRLREGSGYGTLKPQTAECRSSLTCIASLLKGSMYLYSRSLSLKGVPI